MPLTKPICDTLVINAPNLLPVNIEVDITFGENGRGKGKQFETTVYAKVDYQRLNWPVAMINPPFREDVKLYLTGIVSTLLSTYPDYSFITIGEIARAVEAFVMDHADHF